MAEPTIAVLVSSYMEGQLLVDAVRSATRAADKVLVLEGPVGDRPPTDLEDPALRIVAGTTGVALRLGQYVEGDAAAALPPWQADADKRNELLVWAEQHGADWCCWLDGDEALMFPEHLRAMVLRAEAEGASGFPLRIVELDGSVAKAPCRVFRTSAVEEFTLGAHQFRSLPSGVVLSLPNIQICGAGGIPLGYGEATIQAEDLAELRPPVAGEPHILHRAVLRSPERQRHGRLHIDEVQWFEQANGPHTRH